MHSESAGHDFSHLSEEERERLAEEEIARINAKKEKTKKPRMGQGTDPGIESTPVEDDFDSAITQEGFRGVLAKLREKLGLGKKKEKK